MSDYKCEWNKDCPNKATQQLMREETSKIVGDSFAAGIALPPMTQLKSVKVCERHFPEAYTIFFKEVQGVRLVKPLDNNQKESNQYIEPTNIAAVKKCPLCQTTYQYPSHDYCLNDGSLLEFINEK